MPRRARRKPFRRRSTRWAWLEVLESRDPALAEELRELRRYNPHAFRKRILQLSRTMDMTRTSAVYAPASPVDDEDIAGAALAELQEDLAREGPPAGEPGEDPTIEGKGPEEPVKD